MSVHSLWRYYSGMERSLAWYEAHPNSDPDEPAPPPDDDDFEEPEDE